METYPLVKALVQAISVLQRKKLSKDQFVPTALKKREVYGIFGERVSYNFETVYFNAMWLLVTILHTCISMTKNILVFLTQFVFHINFPKIDKKDCVFYLIEHFHLFFMI